MDAEEEVYFTLADGILNHEGATYGVYFDYGDSTIVKSGWLSEAGGHQLFYTYEDAERYGELNARNLLYDNDRADIRPLPPDWKSILPKWCMVTPYGDDPNAIMEFWETYNVGGVRKARLVKTERSKAAPMVKKKRKGKKLSRKQKKRLKRGGK